MHARATHDHACAAPMHARATHDHACPAPVHAHAKHAPRLCGAHARTRHARATLVRRPCTHTPRTTTPSPWALPFPIIVLGARARAAADASLNFGGLDHLSRILCDDVSMAGVYPMPMPPARFGPTFYALVRLPSAGRWRVYMSMRRGGTLATASFGWQAQHLPTPIPRDTPPRNHSDAADANECVLINANTTTTNGTASLGPSVTLTVPASAVGELWFARAPTADSWPLYTGRDGHAGIPPRVWAIILILALACLLIGTRCLRRRMRALRYVQFCSSSSKPATVREVNIGRPLEEGAEMAGV